MINKFGLFLTFLYAIWLSPSLVNPSPLDVFPSSMGSMQDRTSSIWDKANQFLLKRLGTSIFSLKFWRKQLQIRFFWN